MERPTIEAFADVAVRKASFLRTHPLRFFLYAMFAGAWVGLGITLIFSIGAPLASAGEPLQRLAMGASFGIALSLVIFAGAELFTGSNMVMTIGRLEGRTSWGDLASVWTLGLAGNLLGALALALALRSAGSLNPEPMTALLVAVSKAKMNAPFAQLFWRGVLCNILVCLAVWCAGRCKSEAARLIMIFWCLFAFIGSAFEHSIANMTLLAMGIFASAGAEPAVSWSGFLANLVPVTLGNIVGGALIVGAGYWFVSPRAASSTPA